MISWLPRRRWREMCVPPKRKSDLRCGSEFLVWGSIAVFFGGCLSGKPYADRDLEHESERPAIEDPQPITPYAGQDPHVLQAQARLPTGLELHRQVIWRSCTPNDGVCHNRKEYPELRTPGALIAAFGASCNVQAGEAQSIFDGCEPPGDRFVLDSWANKDKKKSPLEIAWIQQVKGKHSEDRKNLRPGKDTPGIHVHLLAPIQLERQGVWGKGRFERRQSDPVSVLHSYSANWWTYDEGRTLFAQVRPYQGKGIAALFAAGIAQADPNRNGISGAKQGKSVQMLEAGAPDKSYLIARVRGEMHGKKIPGSRMPLANQPLTIPEMLALYCFVEGFDDVDRQTKLAAPIDYRNCSYSKNPGELNLLGEGVTWKGRVQKILETHCGGCHGAKEPAAELALVGDGVYARLLQPSKQIPGLPLVTPRDAKRSYLHAKLAHDPEIKGLGMPIDAKGKAQKLSQAELGDILTWIANGAIEDQ